MSPVGHDVCKAFPGLLSFSTLGETQVDLPPWPHDIAVGSIEQVLAGEEMSNNSYGSHLMCVSLEFTKNFVICGFILILIMTQ